jgi:hypothetical protein
MMRMTKRILGGIAWTCAILLMPSASAQSGSAPPQGLTSKDYLRLMAEANEVRDAAAAAQGLTPGLIPQQQPLPQLPTRQAPPPPPQQPIQPQPPTQPTSTQHSDSATQPSSTPDAVTPHYLPPPIPVQPSPVQHSSWQQSSWQPSMTEMQLPRCSRLFRMLRCLGRRWWIPRLSAMPSASNPTSAVAWQDREAIAVRDR